MSNRESFDLAFYDDLGMPFGPDSPRQRALGGSKFVLLQLAHELGARGLRVLVWLAQRSSPRQEVRGNVVYRFGDIALPAHARHLVHHRYSSLAYESKLSWESRWILCSDIWGDHYEHLLGEMSGSLNGVVCVSRWQASLFPESLVCQVLPNPIPAECYQSVPVPRDPNVFVYASAAVKGLISTRDTWADMRLKYPHLRDARLRVLSPGYDDPGFAADYGGVELVGAVPFQDVTDELRRAAGLFFVNDYPETFCIVAAVAEACGARLHIWMRNGGAIRETTNSSLVVTDGEQFESDFLRYFHSPEGAGCAEPRDFSVDRVADMWIDHLKL